MFSQNSSQLFGAKTNPSNYGSFGNPATSQSTGLFQQNKPFGVSTASSQSGFSFGGTSVSSVFGTPASSTTPSFSFGGPLNKTGFGTTTNQSNLSGFNSNPSTTPFGASSTSGGIFNTNFQTNQNTTNQSEYDLFVSSISQPSMCGDDRDVIISRWNQLQAMWGSGIGLSMSGKSVYTPENFLCRFKAVSFNKIPNCEDSDGFVSLLIKGSCRDVLSHKVQMHEKLHQILNNQLYSIVIEDIHPAVKAFNSNNVLPTQPKPSFGFSQQPQPIISQPITTLNNVTEYTDVFVKVKETFNGISRYLPASTITALFKSEPMKSKLESELSVTDVIPQISLNQKEISDYLNGPSPRGINVEIWDRAKQQCANSNTLHIPVPVVGMVELKARIKGQIDFAQSQLATIRTKTETVSEMKTKVIAMSGKIDQLKRKQIELSNRILKILCTQEILSKQGYTLSAEEESLKCSLDKLWNQIIGPYGLKSRLQEILSAPKAICAATKTNSRLSYNNLSNESMEELKEYFIERQKSIKEMMSLIREDISCLDVIENM